MADKTKNNKFVYVTATGKKYHSSSACSYIKNKETYKMILEQAKKKFEGACYRCFKNSNHVINSKIRINLVQLNCNNKDFEILFRIIGIIILTILKIIAMSSKLI